MTLEQQLEKLDGLGLHLSQEVNVDDLVYSFGREAYEEKPFDLILFALGMEVEREPWGRQVSNQAWNFDTECIYGKGDYVTIVQHLCKLSGNENYLRNVSDQVDLTTKKAWLKYQVNGTDRNWTVEVNDDWVDRMVLAYVIDDIERDGKRFYFKDNGQAMILFYLNNDTVQQLNALSENALQPVNVV